MNSRNQPVLLPFMLAGVLASYHPIVYYCSNRSAINQILSPGKRIPGIPAHRKPSARAGQGTRRGRGGVISFKFEAEGTGMGKDPSSWSFPRSDTQLRNEFRRSCKAMPANRETAGMFHRNQEIENHILKVLTLRDLHNILRGTIGGLALV